MRMLVEPLFQPFALPLARGFQPFAIVTAVESILSVLNVQKLSLAANTAVGTQVSVTDGFVVSGFGDARDGFYAKHPTAQIAGSAVYILPNVDTGESYTPRYAVLYPGSSWQFTRVTLAVDDYDGNYATSAAGVEAYPWLADWSGSTPPLALTHPANQQLTAPATAQGGVFVAGGTQDGVYTKRGTDIEDHYNLLGQVDGDPFGIAWSPDLPISGDPAGWAIWDDGGNLLYYSLSDVATPDLAGSDKFVMSVSGVVYSQRGIFNGKPYYNKIGSSTSTALNAIFWSSATWHISNAIGVDLDTSVSGTATPDLATFALGTVVTNTAWLNADDTPAEITVTSVTRGELDAGMIMDGVVYSVNGNLNGRSGYSDVAASEVDTSYAGTRWSGVFTSNLGNTAFPWQATWPDTTVTRDNVASEANWQVVP